MRTKSLVFAGILLLLALAGALILQYSTPIGLGLTNDSQAYLNGARNLLEGNGYGYTSGRVEVKPITHFPPAYAATIAGVSLVSGLEPQRAARVLALVLFAANILLAGLLLGWITRSRLMAVLGALLVLTSEIIFYVHGYLLSEPLYLLVSGLALLLTAVYFERQRWLLLAFAGVLASYAYLTRYVGAAVIAAILIALLLVQPGLKQKLRSASIFLAFNLPGVIAWSLRNLRLTGNPTNRDLFFHPIAADEVRLGLKNFWTWFMPANYTPDAPGAGWGWAAAALGLLLAAGVLLALLRLKREPQEQATRQPALFLLGLYALGYAALIFISMTFVDSSTKFEFRMIVPALLSGTLFLLGWLWQLLSHRPVWIRGLVLACVFGLMLTGAQDTRDRVAMFHNDGQGFLALNWRISKTVAFVNDTLDPQRLIYSNRAPVIYLLTDRTAYVLPTPDDGVKQQQRADYQAKLEELRQDVANGAVVILFEYDVLLASPDGRAWVEDITQGMVPIERTSDGIVFAAER